MSEHAPHAAQRDQRAGAADGPKNVTFFDTTLRDGEQAPGCALAPAEKLRVARQLAQLGVDVIEAGFPASGPSDFEAVRRIAADISGPTVSGLARCVDEDITTCWEAVKWAARPRIHVFLGTSDIHLKHQTRLSREAALELVRRKVALAASLCPADVQFSAMDASRTSPAFLATVVDAAIASGAKTINLSDTVGCALPHECSTMIEHLRTAVPALASITLSVHCHNDLGLATANSLAAIGVGVSQIEVAVNGMGERAGVAALEEVAMALLTRADSLQRSCRIVTTEIARTSRLVAELTGQTISANKPIVGANAFAHESGIHQDGVIKQRATYEIMRPEDLGLVGSEIVIGKHSGRRAVRSRLEELGLDVSCAQLEEIFARLKNRANEKKTVSQTTLRTLAMSVMEPRGLPETERRRRGALATQKVRTTE